MRRSRHIVVLLTAERRTGVRPRIDPGAGGKRDQETLVAEHHMLEHASEEAGFVRHGPNLLRRCSGRGKKVGKAAMKPSA